MRLTGPDLHFRKTTWEAMLLEKGWEGVCGDFPQGEGAEKLFIQVRGDQERKWAHYHILALIISMQAGSSQNVKMITGIKEFFFLFNGSNFKPEVW